jgi:tRNA(adenine34) deaminase
MREFKTFSDEYFMKIALNEAQKGYSYDEIPIGAIVVLNNQIIGKGFNNTEKLNDPTAHAEMIAISSANQFLGSKYLVDATIYVTLEPCIMCAGAIFWSKISRLVYGASDEKNGFLKIENNLSKNSIKHPKLIVKEGILENDCKILLQKFFIEKRKYK